MVIRKLLSAQVQLSRRVERLLPAVNRKDGHLNYIETVVPGYLRPDLCIYDVGGGKRPYLSPLSKQALNARVVGIDTDADELAQAVEGAYDRTFAEDISTFKGGEGDADLIICQAVLEHVEDVDGAIRSIASILKPGGHALIFVPCRNALFARVNLLLPEALKRKVLFAFYPRMSRHQGFPSYYRECTPSGLSRLANRHGLQVESVLTFWTSEYFYALFPVYVVWRLRLTVARTLGMRYFCETFSIVLRQPVKPAALVQQLSDS